MKFSVSSMLPAMLLCLWSCHPAARMAAVNAEYTINNLQFSDFQLRQNLAQPVYPGARWLPGRGIDTSAANPATEPIEHTCLTAASLNSDQAFSGQLKRQLLLWLKLDTLRLPSRDYRFSIDTAAITKAGNMAQLQAYESGIFVWEGLLVKSLSLQVPAGATAAVTAHIKAIAQDAEVTVTQQSGKSLMVVNRFNCYAAYRLVRFSNLMTILYDDVKLEKAGGLKGSAKGKYIKGFTIGRQFTGRIEKLSDYIRNNYNNQQEFETEQRSPSVWPAADTCGQGIAVLEIQCSNPVNEQELSKVKVMLGCANMQHDEPGMPLKTEVIPLSYNLTGNRITSEELEIIQLAFDEQLQYPDVARPGTIRKFVHRKSILSFKPFTDGTTLQ